MDSNITLPFLSTVNLIISDMTLHTSASKLITCVYWDEVVAEDGFLALGRNRYHCTYVIYTDGTYTYAENGTTGKLVYGGPNNLGGTTGTSSAAVLQAALNALTVGRTWKEKVVVKGNHTMTATVTIPSYTCLDMYGANFELGFNGHMFVWTDKTDIEILGGYYDGNKATYDTDLWSCMTGSPVTRLIVKDCIIHDFKGKGFYPARLIGGAIENIISYSNGQDGIYLEGTAVTATERVEVRNCVTYNNGRHGFNVGVVKYTNFIGCTSYSNTNDGWNVEGGTLAGTNYYSDSIKLIDCRARDNGWYGIMVQMGGYRVTLQNCISNNNTFHGLYIRGSDDAYTQYDIKILGGSYYENQQAGISVAYGVKKLKMIGVSVYNNDQVEGGYDGIDFGFTTNLEHVILDDIHSYDDQLAPTQNYGVDFGAVDQSGKDVVCTNIYGEGNTVALWRGTVTETLYIQGYITENQGAGEVIAAAVTSIAVAHGCSITPTVAEISVVLTNLPTNDIGDVYLSAIGAANFTINCRNVPGVATAIFSWAVRRV